jgi:hypothetical protein
MALIFINNSSGSDSNASNIPIKVLILFYKRKNTEEVFSWNIIKDNFIPFVQFLKMKYNVRDSVLLIFDLNLNSAHKDNYEKKI